MRDVLSIGDPWEFACEWYGVRDVQKAIERGKHPIPANVRSPEFAEWLTHQYRLAMSKGISIERANAAAEAPRGEVADG